MVHGDGVSYQAERSCRMWFFDICISLQERTFSGFLFPLDASTRRTFPFPHSASPIAAFHFHPIPVYITAPFLFWYILSLHVALCDSLGRMMVRAYRRAHAVVLGFSRGLVWSLHYCCTYIGFPLRIHSTCTLLHSLSVNEDEDEDEETTITRRQRFIRIFLVLMRRLRYCCAANMNIFIARLLACFTTQDSPRCHFLASFAHFALTPHICIRGYFFFLRSLVGPMDEGTSFCFVSRGKGIYAWRSGARFLHRVGDTPYNLLSVVVIMRSVDCFHRSCVA